MYYELKRNLSFFEQVEKLTIEIITKEIIELLKPAAVFAEENVERAPMGSPVAWTVNMCVERVDVCSALSNSC